MSAFGSDSGTHLVVQLRRIADALEKVAEVIVAQGRDVHGYSGHECWPGCRWYGT